MSPLLTLISPTGLLDLALKSAAVMLLAVATVALLGRASAAWRHLVWCLAVTSLLLLPALSLALPVWSVPWLPQWTAEPAPLVATGPTSPTESNATEPTVVAPLEDQPRTVIDIPAFSNKSATEPYDPRSAPRESTDHAARRGPTTVTSHGGSSLLLAVGWWSGAMLSLVPLAIGLFQLAALHRRSRVMDDPRWLTLLGNLRKQLTVRRSVQLRECDAALAPLTWGALRPVLLVPAEATGWPDERRRLVLLHELAHVRRWDWLTQLVAHVACALYWFNPLVWVAARQMRIERERACDDLVLASGARASDYAQELLALAAGLSHSQLSTLVAVPMARRGVLEDRLRGILDSRRSRAAVTTAAVCLSVALVAAVLAPLAMLRAAPAESAKAVPEEPKNEPPVKETPAAEKAAPKPVEKITAIEQVLVRGKVVDDEKGEPIGQFIMQGGKFDPADPQKVTWGYWERTFVGSDGSFDTTIRWPEGWTARIVADGFVPHPVLTSAPPKGKENTEVTIRLKRGPKVRGVVLDHAGKPLKDAAVYPMFEGKVLNVVAGQAWSQAPDYGPDDRMRPARTDEQGRFELATGGVKRLAVSHAQFDAWPAEIPDSGEVTVRLPKPAHIEVNLDIDGADKESVIFYQLLSNHMPGFGLLQSSRWVKVDNPGKLSLVALPPGKYQLCRRPGKILERQLFEIAAGETKTFDFVRKQGARVRGKVTWPEGAKLASIGISVVGETTQKSPFDQFEWNPVYAALSPNEDGTFLTERIPPGTYQLQAYAYKPLTEEQQRRTGAIAPSYHAQLKIEVPAEGELKVDDLALKLIRAKEPAQEPPAKEKPAAEKPADQPNDKPAVKKSEPASNIVTFRGQVVDDVTGVPIPNFKIQNGKPHPDLKQIVWGWHEKEISDENGSFLATLGGDEQWTARVLAGGYFPQPVHTGPLPTEKEKLDVTIRLKRIPAKVRGVVLDHAGKPLKDAAVFTVPAKGVNVAAGQAWSTAPDYQGRWGIDKDAKPVRTDEEGRFEIPTGGATLLGVSHAQFDAWPAEIPAKGDITVRLPQPARVEITLNIDGAGNDHPIFYQLLSHLKPEFGMLQSSRTIAMANPGKLVLAALPPGKYQFCRRPGRMLDREIFDLKAGETKIIDYVRTKGARVRGKVTWPADAKLMSIVVSVLSEKNGVLASTSPGGDGSFLTERIPPGKHQLIAYAFAEQTPERLTNTSPIIPSYEAQPIQIDVPADGEVKGADLVLKPIPGRDPKEPPAKEKPAAEKPVDKPAEKPAKPAATTVIYQGKVVDDATGEKIDRFFTQGGKFDPADPTKVTWGTWELRTLGPADWFQTEIKWGEGMTARIVADGYLPEPVLTSAPPEGKKIVETTVRLKRGRKVRGVVLDHTGKPLKDAAVFPIGQGVVTMAAGEVLTPSGAKPARTDEQGRFELAAGDAKSLAVSHLQFDAWPAIIPESGEVTVRLPEPARIEINLDIDGADKESNIYYELIVSQMPEFRALVQGGVLRLDRYASIANPGKLVLAGLPPGKYQLSRRPGRMLENQMFEIKSGEVKTIDYIRKTGARVRGKLTWPADAKLYDITVTVTGEPVRKSPWNNHQWATVYAALTPAKDGTFLTERIPPGTYELAAYAYAPSTGNEGLLSGFGGISGPSFYAAVTITVPAEGEVKADDLELKSSKAGK